MHDLRLALRQITAAPAFTLIAIFTLALGIGACTAIFSVINALVLRPLPFVESEQIVQVWDRRITNISIYPTGRAYQLWRDENTTFDSLAVTDPAYRTLTGGRSPERIKGILASANYLHTLRVRPMLGRDFAPDADKLGGANNVVILSHAMWVTRCGSDPGIVDRSIILDNKSHVVVGVLPPDALPRDDALFLLPLVFEPNTFRVSTTVPWALVTGRLNPGASVADAEAELNAITLAHAAEFPVDKQIGVSVVPLREQLTSAARPGMFMLGCAGILVLLIACANVANLLLARATARAKEMAVRSALGAAAPRIVRLVLTENLLLALLGGALAVLFALLSVDLLGAATRAVDPSVVGASGAHLNLRLTGGELPVMLRPEVDWVVLLFALATAIVTGIGCGLFPALRACRSDVCLGLKESGRSSTAGGRTRIQSALVALEVGLTAILLISAGLFLRSFAKVVAVDPGFNPQQVITFDLAFPAATYPTPADVIRFEENVVRQLAAQPGIMAVGAATNLPFGPGGWGGTIGRPEEADRKLDVTAGTDYVEGNFFAALDVPLRRGRLFTPEDNQPEGPRVAIINEALARRLFPDQDPIGRRVITSSAQHGLVWEVVGVVGDIRNRSLERSPSPIFYGPHAFNPGQASIVVRSDLPAPVLRDLVTRTVRGVDADQPVAIQPLSVGIEKSVEGRQSMMVLVEAFAIVALVLACLGIYGVMAYTINQRQRELSIRMALGASQPNVVGLVLRDGLRLALIGLGIGLLAAMAGAQLIASLLFGVSAHDPWVFVSVPIVLMVVAWFACWLPARRAAHADPIQALRAD